LAHFVNVTSITNVAKNRNTVCIALFSALFSSSVLYLAGSVYLLLFLPKSLYSLGKAGARSGYNYIRTMMLITKRFLTDLGLGYIGGSQTPLNSLE